MLDGGSEASMGEVRCRKGVVANLSLLHNSLPRFGDQKQDESLQATAVRCTDTPRPFLGGLNGHVLAARPPDKQR